MISTQGLSALMAIGLIASHRDRFEADVRNDPQSKREIAAFRSRIGSITSVDDLMKDYQALGFALKAFGLESQVSAKAMIRKILTSDPSDKTSLVNKLTDARYKELNATFGFGTDGRVQGTNFGSATWVDSLVDRYVDQRLIATQTDANPSVGLALAFEAKAPKLTSWYKVLADKQMGQFFRTAFNLPDAIATGDVDSQVRALKARFDITTLKDPKVVQKLVRQYAAIAGTQDAAASRSAVMDLFTRSSASKGSWSAVTIDVEAVRGFSGSAYR